MSNNRLRPLEFETLKAIERVFSDGSARCRVLVAVSGGRDSVALLNVLAQIRGRLDWTLAIAHVHHGPSPVSVIQAARDRASEVAKAHSLRLGLDFHLIHRNGADSLGQEHTGGDSEEALREFRHARLSTLRVRNNFDWVAYAHHHEDLFETRLLRLIRGTGPDGLRAMRIKGAGRKLRPWLGFSRAMIESYATETGLEWSEDPTNSDTGMLRNWVRRDWLPALETRRPGSVECLARSLALLAERISGAEVAGRWSGLGALCIVGDGIDRLAYQTLREREQRFVLALYTRETGVRDLGEQRLKEIRKRLDTDQKSLSFRVGGLQWVINARQIRAILA